jgi:hypothetical protein
MFRSVPLESDSKRAAVALPRADRSFLDRSGGVRENVKPVWSDLPDRIDFAAMGRQEFA